MKLTKKLFLLAAALLSSACSTIGPGERGVSVLLGHASQEVLEPGIYLYVPGIRSIEKMSVQIQKTDISASASSKDLQEVTTAAALNWHINPADSVKIYTNVGGEYDIVNQIIIPAFNEILKQATAKKTAEEVISKRADLKGEVDTGLITRLKGYGIYVDDINIVDVKFSPDFARAIEAKQVAEQKSQQAVYEAQKAANDATAAINTAKGQAESQRLVRQSIDRELLTLEALKKWNGVLPQYMTGNGSLPFINLAVHGDSEK